MIAPLVLKIKSVHNENTNVTTEQHEHPVNYPLIHLQTQQSQTSLTEAAPQGLRALLIMLSEFNLLKTHRLILLTCFMLAKISISIATASYSSKCNMLIKLAASVSFTLWSKHGQHGSKNPRWRRPSHKPMGELTSRWLRPVLYTVYVISVFTFLNAFICQTFLEVSKPAKPDKRPNTRPQTRGFTNMI